MLLYFHFCNQLIEISRNSMSACSERTLSSHDGDLQVERRQSPTLLRSPAHLSKRGLELCLADLPGTEGM